MATEKTKALAAIKVKPTFLGRYAPGKQRVGGKEVPTIERDGWHVGELFTDRTGRRVYEVQLSGALKRV